MMQSDPEAWTPETLEKLTKAQRTACWNLSGEWSLAPHDGWRRSGQVCSALVKLGLADKDYARMRGVPMYRLNEYGLEVQAALRARASLAKDEQ